MATRSGSPLMHGRPGKTARPPEAPSDTGKGPPETIQPRCLMQSNLEKLGEKKPPIGGFFQVRTHPPRMNCAADAQLLGSSVLHHGCGSGSSFASDLGSRSGVGSSSSGSISHGRSGTNCSGSGFLGGSSGSTGGAGSGRSGLNRLGLIATSSQRGSSSDYSSKSDDFFHCRSFNRK